MTTDIGQATSTPDLTAKIRDTWDATADSYGLGNFDTTERQRAAWSALLSRLFPPPEPLSIVDIGCGPGFIALTLAELGHTVTAVDLSSEMLRICRAAATARGITDIRLVQGEAEFPPPDIGPVDAVISRHLLWTLPWPERAITAWTGLTKPGGRVLSIDSLWSPELIAEMNEDDYPPDVVPLLPLLHARDLAPVHNLWRRAGLVDVMTEELAWIDKIIHAEVSMELRPMYRDLSFFLVEGTRPAQPPATSGSM